MLIESANTAVKFSSDVAEAISGYYAGAEVTIKTSATDYDIPFHASSLLGADRVFVFVTHSRDPISMNKVNMVLSKLIDLEVANRKQVYKIAALVEGDLGEGEVAAIKKEVTEYCMKLLAGESPSSEVVGHVPSEPSPGVFDFFKT